jgi:hypothetical protein
MFIGNKIMAARYKRPRKADEEDETGQKKRHLKSGVLAIRELRYYQQTGGLLCGRAGFRRLTANMVRFYTNDKYFFTGLSRQKEFRFTAAGYLAIQVFYNTFFCFFII